MAFDWKKSISPREQVLSGLVLLAFVTMFFRVVYFPKRDGNEDLAKKIVASELEQSSLEKFTQALMQATPQKVTLQVQSPALQVLKGSEKPAAKAIADLLSILSDRDFLQGLSVKELNDLPPKQERGYRKITFTVKVAGPFVAAMNYIKRVENLPVLLSVDLIEMLSPAFQSEEITLELIGTLIEMEHTS